MSQDNLDGSPLYQGMEVVELTRQMMYNPGNAVKRIASAGDKDINRQIEYLSKAVLRIEDEIRRLPKNTPMSFTYGHLPLILASQMSRNRGSAVKAICLGTIRDLHDALGYLIMEIEILEWARNHPAFPETDITP